MSKTAILPRAAQLNVSFLTSHARRQKRNTAIRVERVAPAGAYTIVA